MALEVWGSAEVRCKARCWVRTYCTWVPDCLPACYRASGGCLQGSGALPPEGTPHWNYARHMWLPFGPSAGGRMRGPPLGFPWPLGPACTFSRKGGGVVEWFGLLYIWADCNRTKRQTKKATKRGDQILFWKTGLLAIRFQQYVLLRQMYTYNGQPCVLSNAESDHKNGGGMESSYAVQFHFSLKEFPINADCFRVC